MAVTSLWRFSSYLGTAADYVTNEEKTLVTVAEKMEEGGDWTVKLKAEAILGAAADYMSREAATLYKTETGTLRLVTGVNCSADKDRAVSQMMKTKKRFSKLGGVTAYHGYQSFAPGEGPPELIHQIGVETAQRLWGDRYEVLVATHVDKENHLHNHFVLNTVSFVDGKKYRRTKWDYQRMRDVSDQLCREYGFSVIENPKDSKRKNLTWQPTPGKKNRASIVRPDVDDAIAHSNSIQDFFKEMQAKGYRLKIGQDISVWTQGFGRYFRLANNFGDRYTQLGIEEQIVARRDRERREAAAVRPQKGETWEERSTAAADDGAQAVAVREQQTEKTVLQFQIPDAVKKNLELKKKSFLAGGDSRRYSPEPDFNKRDMDSDGNNSAEEWAEPDNDKMSPFYGEKRTWWTDEYKSARSFLYGGKDIPPDFDQALSMMRSEAKSGNGFAMYDLGRMYLLGLGCDKDEERAQKWFGRAYRAFIQEEAAVKKKSYLRYRIGKLRSFGYGVEQDYSEAARWYQKAVDEENPFAAYSLGSLYRRGQGVERDNARAFSLYTVAAQDEQRSNAYAAYELGRMCRDGVGTAPDQAASDNWYRRAYQGFLDMENIMADDKLYYRLGRMNLNGVGTSVDIPKAKQYFEKAAEFHNTDALYGLGRLYLNRDFPDYDPEKAVDYLTDAARSGHDFAQYTLGRLFLQGNETAKNVEYGLQWLEESAGHGNSYAEYLLGKTLLVGKDVVRDVHRAADLLYRSADQGNRYAQYTLGKALLDGRLLPRDIPEGIRLITEAADAEFPSAQYLLGKLLYQGKVIPRDLDRAADYLERAAAGDSLYGGRTAAQRMTVGGYQALYARFVYRLGGYTGQRSKEAYWYVPPSIRAEMLKLTQYSEEGKLLCRCKINTLAELCRYRDGLQKEVQELTVQQTQLRNGLRRKGQSTQTQRLIRKQMAAVNSRLFQMRRDIRLCDSIEQRSGSMAVQLKAAERELVQERRRRGIQPTPAGVKQPPAANSNKNFEEVSL